MNPGMQARIGTPSPADSPDQGLVTFGLGDALYAFHVESVLEVVSPLLVTALFSLPDHVLGVMNLRGRVLPVSRLAALLGMRSPHREERVGLRVRCRNEEAVFAVDRVHSVLWISSSRWEDLPGSSREMERAFFAGILPLETPVTRIAVEKLFEPALWGAAPGGAVS